MLLVVPLFLLRAVYLHSQQFNYIYSRSQHILPHFKLLWSGYLWTWMSSVKWETTAESRLLTHQDPCQRTLNYSQQMMEADWHRNSFYFVYAAAHRQVLKRWANKSYWNWMERGNAGASRGGDKKLNEFPKNDFVYKFHASSGLTSVLMVKNRLSHC